MPASITGRHAAETILDESPEMTTVAEQQKHPICDTDHSAIIPLGNKKDEAEEKTKVPVDRQSWNYIVRSGIAGGLAGCAVCDHEISCHTRPCGD